MANFIIFKKKSVIFLFFFFYHTLLATIRSILLSKVLMALKWHYISLRIVLNARRIYAIQSLCFFFHTCLTVAITFLLFFFSESHGTHFQTDYVLSDYDNCLPIGRGLWRRKTIQNKSKNTIR